MAERQGRSEELERSPQGQPSPLSSRMERSPPSRSSVAWEEDRAPQESSSPSQLHEVTAVQPLQIDASWLPVYKEEQDAVDFIVAFISCPRKSSGFLEEGQKKKFLESICRMCRTAKCRGLSEGMDVFFDRYELADNIKVLLEDEPRDKLCTALREEAMDAIFALSSVEKALEGKMKSLLEACFSSVFLLAPEEQMQYVDRNFYSKAVTAMVIILHKVLPNSPVWKVKEEVQNIIQLLINGTESEREDVQKVALHSIRTLRLLMDRNPTLEARRLFGLDEDAPICYEDIQIPDLGQLLGRRLLFAASKKRRSCPPCDVLMFLESFIIGQKRTSMPKDEAEQLHWEPETLSLLGLPTTTDMRFANYLKPSERTDIVLVTIEALRDSSAFEKDAVRAMLDVLMRDPAFWLRDVPKIMGCIHRTLEGITMAPAQQSMGSLLLLLTNHNPMQVVTSLLKMAPPRDSTALAMWEVIFSTPQTFENVLKELLRQLQSCSLITSATEDTCSTPLAPTASRELQAEDFGGESHDERDQRHPSLVTVSHSLKVLIMLSERPDMAREMLVHLPLITEVLHGSDGNIKMKVLVVIQNIKRHLERKEASAIAVQLVEELLPLFDNESSQLRELSMGLFRDMVESVEGSDKEKIQEKVQRGLLPLFFHMSDQIRSVAKVSREALLAAAELLQWKLLKELVQREQPWRIGECLLAQGRSRAEEHLDQSLPYLEDAQATLREAAIRFIGLAARHVRLQNQQKLSEIISALEPFRKDSDIVVRFWAACVIDTLSSQRVQPRLCCIL
ncbi:maestro heat-like repeat-containing protein family member 7 [Nyctibius grandis]|uniref:maestro heat-like repeat-containing protein family member 7 n=1 Tax=Nyctibius grandis TaxID=48427 RepID=UPI0035BC6B6F